MKHGMMDACQPRPHQEECDCIEGQGLVRDGTPSGLEVLSGRGRLHPTVVPSLISGVGA